MRHPFRHMPKLLKILATPLIGLAIIVAGFVYDIMFAGIPYQDPTPELLASWKFHSSVAFWIMTTGLVIFSVGLFLIPFLARTKPEKPDSE